jgi:hypothetical protein
MDDLVQRITRSHGSEFPVTVARYTVEVVMNEEAHQYTDVEHVAAFEAEFQRALDAGFFTSLRYDAMQFEVKREIIETVPAEQHRFTPGQES